MLVLILCCVVLVRTDCKPELSVSVTICLTLSVPHDVAENRRSSEIQGTALGKSLQAWTCIYRSMLVGVVQSRHAFVGGTVSTWAR